MLLYWPNLRISEDRAEVELELREGHSEDVCIMCFIRRRGYVFLNANLRIVVTKQSQLLEGGTRYGCIFENASNEEFIKVVKTIEESQSHCRDSVKIRRRV